MDICITEVGGTVGDIESLPFLEALRQLKLDLGPVNSVNVHVTLVPYIAAAGELKTKPTQHSVQKLREIGIQPEIIVARCDRDLAPELKRKISLFCNVRPEAVINGVDVSSIYEVPIAFHRQGLDSLIIEQLNIWAREPQLERWESICRALREATKRVTVAIVGKYVDHTDAYKSLHEALLHGGIAHLTKVDLRYIDSESIEEQGAKALLDGADAILVPGGFGDRGTEGKIEAIKYARENSVPFFGICLGLQLAVVEFCRNICGISDANSVEFAPDGAHSVIHLMAHQHKVVRKGGSMRLGSYACVLKSDSKACEIYGSTEINERHRHRYEVNNSYREAMEDAGLTFSGLSPDKELVEMVELASHPWFVGCQFHPEFKSRPYRPHPLFSSFIEAALDFSDEQ